MRDLWNRDFSEKYNLLKQTGKKVLPDSNIFIFALPPRMHERIYCKPIIDDIIDRKINAVVPTIVLLEVFHKCVYKFHIL
ncbi:MAG TPA: hypothetical protein EYP22_03230 [Methanosarcinales archaeon]|nr:hypothetical protein [Methanosarcinales archaeon]